MLLNFVLNYIKFKDLKPQAFLEILKIRVYNCLIIAFNFLLINLSLQND